MCAYINYFLKKTPKNKSLSLSLSLSLCVSAAAPLAAGVLRIYIIYLSALSYMRTHCPLKG